MAQSGWVVIGDAVTRVEVKFAALQLQSGYPDDPPQGGNVPMGNFGELSSEIFYSQVELKRSKAAHLFNVCWCAFHLWKEGSSLELLGKSKFLS